jgi:hydroxyethylthiazole kinase-like uncharacterized protein yjeF
LKNIVAKDIMTLDEMKLVEKHAEDCGISRMLMMENAGSSIARFVYDKFALKRRNEAHGKIVAVCVAGTGNNGGDVLAAARHLAYWKRHFAVRVILVGEPSRIKAEEALSNWKILSSLESIPKTIFSSADSIREFYSQIKMADLLIVGIFGTGFHGKPEGVQAIAIDAINQARVFTVSADIPSGLNGMTGEAENAIESDATITMHAIKTGMVATSEARKKCGKIVIANIGVPT